MLSHMLQLLAITVCHEYVAAAAIIYGMLPLQSLRHTAVAAANHTAAATDTAAAAATATAIALLPLSCP
jgi:hypothetical protein